MWQENHKVQFYHVCWAWIKNVNRLASHPEITKEMFSDLGLLMNYCSSDEVSNAINAFFNKFSHEEKFLDYLHKNWVAGDKICKLTNSFLHFTFRFSYRQNIFINPTFLQLGMWAKICQDLPHANHERKNVAESYHCYKDKFSIW